jgi:probable phosphoglycerate mutase
MKNIYFIRHGESEGNKLKHYQSSDTLLSETGHQQAKVIAERLTSIDIELLISSTYKRALQTTGHIRERIEIPVIESSLFVERKRPSIQENQPKTNIKYQSIDTEIQTHWADLDWRHSDEENFSDLKLRAQQCFEYLEQQEADNIAVVTHKNFLHCLVWYRIFGTEVTPREAKVVTENFVMSNTGIVWMQFDEEARDWNIITWNDHAHLG